MATSIAGYTPCYVEVFRLVKHVTGEECVSGDSRPRRTEPEAQSDMLKY